MQGSDAPAGPTDLDRLPSVLALPLAEYRSDPDPLLKLWHLCDFVELALRTAFALGLADWRRSRNQLPKKLRADIALRLQQPTLGKWRGLALAVAAKPPPDTMFPELTRFVNEDIEPLLVGDGSQAVESSLLALRNRLAHGGGISRTLAGRLIDGFAHRANTIVDRMSWLMDVHFAVPKHRLASMRGATTELSTADEHDSEELVHTTRQAVGDTTNAVVAIRDGKVASLWPFVQYGLPWSANQATTPRHEVPQIYARRGEVRLILTPLGSTEAAICESDEAAVGVVEQLTARPAPKRSFQVKDFDDEFRRDASRSIGRERELDALTRTVHATTPGLVWLGGTAGIGKSFVVATLLSRLRTSHSELVLGYRFKRGDPRCHRDRFLAFAIERLEARYGEVPSGDRRAPVDRMAQILAGTNEPTAIVVDGLENIIEIDTRFLAEVIEPLSDHALWLCAGRPQAAVMTALEHSGATPAFPNGLPGMSRADVRQMLLDKIGPLSKRLIAKDRDDGESTVNPFIERVVACASGLPIYVAYVIGDALSGRLRQFDSDTSLPPSLEDYHSELLRGCAISSAHQILTPLISTLAIARAPLSLDTLLSLLTRRTLVTADATGTEALQHALAASATLLYRTSETSEDHTTHRYQLFHDTLAKHLLSQPSSHVAISTARTSMARAVVDYHQQPEPTRQYLFQYGIDHLIDTHRYETAAKLLSNFAYLHDRVSAMGAETIVDILTDIENTRQKLPTADPSLETMAEFLRSHAHVIERGGSEALLQAAIAHADSSPVTQAAERWVAATPPTHPWIRRIDRPSEPRRNPCRRTLEGHRSVVTDVALLSQDRAVSSSGDATLKVWCTKTGACLATLKDKPTDRATSVMATMPAARCWQQIPAYPWTVWAVAALDRNRVVAAHGDKQLRLWNLTTGQCENVLPGHHGYTWSLEAMDERVFASAGDDGIIRIWDLEHNAPTATYAGHHGWISQLLRLPNQQRLASAGGDGTIRLWNLDSANEVARTQGHAGYAASVSSLPGGGLLSGGGDGTIATWDSELRGIHRWPAHSGGVWRVAAVDDSRALSCGHDGELAVWDRRTGTKLRSLRGHTAWPLALRILPGGEAALSTSVDGTLKIWDIRDHETRRTGKAQHLGAIRDICFRGQDHVVTAGTDGDVRLWEAQSARSLKTCRGHSGSVNAVAILDETHIASAGSDNTLRVWDINTGQQRHCRRLDGEPLSLSVAPPGKLLVTTADALLQYTTPEDEGERIPLFTDQRQQTITTSATDPTGRYAIIACGDYNARVFDLQTHNPVCTLRGHAWDILGVTLLANGNYAATASKDKSIKVWKLPQGRCIDTLLRFSGNCQALAAWPDRPWLAFATQDRTIEVWDIKARQTICQWAGDSPISAITIAPNGRIATADRAGFISYLEIC